VSELTAANYIIAKDTGVPLIGIPVVPNVFYPLSGIMVNKAAGIKTPQDLAGKRVGVSTGYASNPGAWLRGILTHQFDVSSERITWIEGEADSLAGVPYPRSSRYKTEKLTDLPARLIAGDIDALIGPGGAAAGDDKVGLFTTDPMPLTMEYFNATNVLPINTMLVMKEATHAANPGLADAVIAASLEANALYHDEEKDDGVHQGLPVGALRKAGLFPRLHGLETHGDTVRMLVQYLFEQGLIKKLWTLDELFV
jgi:4,5-dihydroxyphthalate decarboxylase